MSTTMKWGIFNFVAAASNGAIWVLGLGSDINIFATGLSAGVGLFLVLDALHDVQT